MVRPVREVAAATNNCGSGRAPRAGIGPYPIIGVSRPWVVPFVVQLLGEYVVEIAELILRRVNELPADLYLQFANENNDFIRLTRRRVVSYWACYYAGRYRLAEYPPLRAMKELGLWHGNEGRRRLRL